MACTVLGALAAAGCANAGGGAVAEDSLRPVDIDLRVDTAHRGFRVPDKYVGLALSSKYVTGAAGNLQLFSPSKNSHYAELVNLAREIGVKHIRMVSGDGPDDNVLPDLSQDADLFKFVNDVGLGEHSLVYSLPLADANGASDIAPVTDLARRVWSDHGSIVESFALSNEPDCHNWSNDPGITDASSYKRAWEARYNAIQLAIPGPARVPFSGPDACAAGASFMQGFAIDEHSRISLATQHFYGAATDEVPAWQRGAGYQVGDVVSEGNSTYRCIESTANSQAPPSQNPDVWRSAPAALSGEQLAMGMLNPDWMPDMYQRMYDTLAGSSRWPRDARGEKLGYRFTEANAYSDPTLAEPDTANQLFGLALWSLDFFHWWAAHGTRGVDPFTNVAKYNSPIYLDPASSEFVAEPYAYGMRAFAEGSDGTTIDPSAVTFSRPVPKWLSAYPVLGDNGHLYVTLINKTFERVGSKDAHVKIQPAGFHAARGTKLVLASAPGASGVAAVRSETLGGAILPASGRWNGKWEPVHVNHDGSIEVTVQATTAVVVDVTN
jgi:hypothetical protein